MKNGWPTRALADVCNIASALVDPRMPQYQDMIHVGGANIKAETGELLDLKTARQEGLKSGKFVFDETMVLYSKIRPYLMKVARPDFEGLCSADIYPLSPDPLVLDRGYLFHHLLSPQFTEFAVAGSARAGMPKVNRDHLFTFRLPVPPLAEQQRIAGVLDEAFAGIATAQANAAKNLQNARALFESHLQSVFTERGKGWQDSTIGAEIKFIDYRGKTPAKTTSGVRLITAKNVKMGYLQESPMEFIASGDYEGWMTRGIPRKGDVLFTTEAPLANVAQLDTDEKVAFAQRIIIMQANAAKLDSAFLKYLLLSQPVQQRIRTQGTGATVQGIKASLLKLIAISFPKALDEQRRIVAKLDALRDETQRLESLYQQKVTALAALKKSLLHQAFTGQL